MNERSPLGLIVIAGFVGTVFGIISSSSHPVFGLAAESFLTVERSTVSIDDGGDNGELTAELEVEGLRIPTNGTRGAFGYGIFADDADDAILIVHTHPGVLDSEAQRFIDDPVWHNHFVRLSDVDQCGEDQGVVDITWQSPGQVEIDDNIAIISDVPTGEFEGWHSITGQSLLITLGQAISDVISFKLHPVFGEEGLEAMCITHIRSTEEVVNLD